MRKRISLLVMIVGLVILGSFPVKALRQSFVQESYVQSYEKKDYLETPIEEVERKVQYLNRGPIKDPFAPDLQPLENKINYTLGYIKIPKIGETLPLYIGASNENLDKGVAQITGTALPMSGKGTHTYLAGHRMTAQSNMFLFIDQLVPGDLIFLSYLGQEAVYVVTGNEIIEPTQGEKLLEVDPNEELLSLLTCHPFPTDKQRLLVHSKRLGEEQIKKLTNVQPEKPVASEDVSVEADSQLFETIMEQQTSIKTDAESEGLWSITKTWGIKNNKEVLFASLLVIALLVVIWTVRLILTFRKK